MQVNLILPTKIWVNWPFDSGEVQNRLSIGPPWRPSLISDRKDFSYFLFESHHDISYQVLSELAFHSGDEGQNRFSRLQPWQSSWISNLNSYFWSASWPNISYPVSSKLAFWFRRWRAKQIFKMDDMAAILGFRLEQYLLFLLCKLPQYFLPSFESIGLLVQEKKRKIDFQDGGHLGFPIRTILSIFDQQVTPMLPIKFRISWAKGVEGVGI